MAEEEAYRKAAPPPPPEIPVANLSSTATYDHVQPGVVIAGRYELLEKLGEGGMGEVWAARQLEPVKRRVAVKLIKKGMDSKAVLARFEQERQALAVMDHPNIARVHDGGLTDQGAPFFVMELVAGLPLTRFCDEAKLTVRERLEIFVAVCQAVQHAHQKGLVHRDLKPANILVTLVDGRPTPKVIDFGVAKALSGKLTEQTLSTHVGAVVGTLEYMAPEQAGLAALDVDTRADIYSLGTILYELLTGSRPFDASRLKRAALDEMIRIIREEEPPSLASRLSTDASLPSVAALRRSAPRQLISQLRGELDWIARKCLEKDRGRRYETANGLARDLQRYLADEPVEARPATAGYKLRKFVRRNRPQVIAASLVLLALVAGIASTTWGLVWAMREREEKQKALQDAVANEKKAIEERDAKDKALRAETQARLAEKQARDQAMAALRTMTDEVIEIQMGRSARLTEENKAFLRKTIKLYEGFAAIAADDAQSRAIKAEGYARVGRMRHRLADFKEAEAAYVRAVEGFRRLVAEQPASSAYRGWLSTNQRNLGLLYGETARPEEARRAFTESLAVRKQLVKEFGDEPGWRKDLAASHDSLGTVLRDTGQLGDAEAEYSQALAIRKQLVAQFPDDIEFQRELAQGHNNMGALFRSTNRPEAATREAESALAIRKRLVAAHPNRPEFRGELARSHNNLGVFHFDAGELEASVKSWGEAQALLRQLAAEFPARLEFRRDLALTSGNLANALCDLHRTKESEDAYREAIASFRRLIADYPTLPEFRHNLALSLANLGTLHLAEGHAEEAVAAQTEAVSVYKELVALAPKQPEFRYGLANAYANLAYVSRRRRDVEGIKANVALALPEIQAARNANPKNADYQEVVLGLHLLLAHAHAYQLDQPAALHTAEAIRAFGWDPPRNTYDAARCLVECISAVETIGKLDAEQRQAAIEFYGAQAVGLLREAVAKGQPGGVLHTDHRLDALRGREDFKKLLAEVASKPPTAPPAGTQPKPKP